MFIVQIKYRNDRKVKYIHKGSNGGLTVHIKRAKKFKSEQSATKEMQTLLSSLKDESVSGYVIPFHTAPAAIKLEAKATAAKTKTQSKRETIYRKCHGKCAYCGVHISLDDFQIEHIRPKAKGGTNNTGNLFPSCRRCNTYKKDLSLEEFREFVRRARKYADLLASEPDKSLLSFLNSHSALLSTRGDDVAFYFEEQEIRPYKKAIAECFLS